MSRMSQPSSLTARAPVSRLLQRHGRLAICLPAAVLGFLATWPLDFGTRLIVGLDVGAFVYLGLFVTLMNQTTQEQAAELASKTEPSGAIVLLGVIAMSLISVVAVGALHQPGPDAPKIVYLASSLSAVVLAWLLVHIRFGLYYMHIYYDDTVSDEVSAFD